MFMDAWDQVPLILPKMQDQTSLMLWWCWFSRWGRERVAFSFSYNGSQYFIYNCLQSITTQITKGARPNTADALLTLIFKMGQGACHNHCCLLRLPIHWICITTTESIFNLLTYKSCNCWCSVATHFATGESAMCNHVIWHNLSFTVFWQPFYCLHVLSPWSLHCSLIIHINIFFKIYFKVSANCRW